MALEGNLETFYLSSLFQLLSNDKKTGKLRIANDEDVVTVTFSEGTIICATSTDNETHLGYLLRSEGVIANDELEKHLQLARNRKQRLGKVLVDEFYLSKEELKNFIRQQAENILFSLFMWTGGKFKFEESDVSFSDETDTQFDTMELILEASRRVDEISVLEKQVPTRDQIVQQVHAQETTPESASKLTPHENAVLQLVDGRRSIKEIVFQSGYDEFTVFKSLYTLLSSGIIEVKEKIAFALDNEAARPGEKKPAEEAPPSLAPDLKKSPLVETAATEAPAAETPLRLGPTPVSPAEGIGGRVAAQEAPAVVPGTGAETAEAAEALALLQKPEKKLLGMPRAYAVAVIGAAVVLLITCAGAFLYMKTDLLKPFLPAAPESVQPAKHALPASKKPSGVKKPAAATAPEPPPPLKDMPLPRDSVVDTKPILDKNSFVFLSLPIGFSLQDNTKPDKSQFTVTYSKNIKVQIIAKPWTDEWNAEDAMYRKIVDYQTGKAEGFRRAVDFYSLLNLSGCTGYEITALGSMDATFWLTRFYTMVGHDKMVIIEVQCKNCKQPKNAILFDRINEVIKQSLTVYQ